MNHHLRRGIDIEQIIMGEELCDAHIKTQFPELGGLQSTLLQQKETYIVLVGITG